MRAKQLNASFTYLIDGRAFLHLDTLDLYSLFGNILDNAFEAIENLPSNKRVIELKAERLEDLLIIRCTNFFDDKITHKTDNTHEFIPTSKNDSDWHGFGLRSINTTAQKYGGTMTTQISADIFTISVMMCAAPTDGVSHPSF